MMSPVRKRSIVLNGHKTSVSVEDEFWSALKEIAASRSMTMSDFCSEIDKRRENGNLSSAMRLYVLAYYVERSKGKLLAQPIEPIGP
jgi:predicted DNA-binding ribbon-helix-helix protein